MMNLHVFIDGSWLFKACGPEKVLANRTENYQQPFSVDFKKLNDALLRHVAKVNPLCDRLGDLFFCTSIFELPSDFDNWWQYYNWITCDDIERVRKSVYARTMFTNNALAAGYSDQAVYRPKIKDYTIRNLKDDRYQEKQVDSSVVALLVRSAITCPQDYHAVITGDADILPAVKVAYPKYTQNVVIVTSHPDELRAEHKQASYSLNNFDFDIPVFFLQEHAVEIIEGIYPYICADCSKVFVRSRPIPTKSQPHCRICWGEAQKDK